MGFLLGFGLFFILEPLIVNVIYFKNIQLFLDTILNKKNKTKIIEYIKKNY